MVEVDGLGMKVCDISLIKVVIVLGSFIQFPLTVSAPILALLGHSVSYN